MTVGDNIKRIGLEKNMSIYKISKDSKVSNGYLNDLVNNIQSNPSITIIKKIAIALGTTVDELIQEREVC